MTPAMAAILSDHICAIEELVGNALKMEEELREVA